MLPPTVIAAYAAAATLVNDDIGLSKKDLVLINGLTGQLGQLTGSWRQNQSELSDRSHHTET